MLVERRGRRRPLRAGSSVACALGRLACYSREVQKLMSRCYVVMQHHRRRRDERLPRLAVAWSRDGMLLLLLLRAACLRTVFCACVDTATAWCCRSGSQFCQQISGAKSSESQLHKRVSGWIVSRWSKGRWASSSYCRCDASPLTYRLPRSRQHP